MADSRIDVEHSLWGVWIPWILTTVSLIVLSALVWFLLSNLNWFRSLAFPPNANRDPWFTLYAFHLHLSMVKRSVGLFAGFALIFIGTAVSFYSLKYSSMLEGRAQSMGAKLSTASPGIIAMVLGTALIAFTIWSKDDFQLLPPEYLPQLPATNRTQPGADRVVEAPTGHPQ